jgi:3-(3-hydroxy-phenyl)propionate hydroxylase
MTDQTMPERKAHRQFAYCQSFDQDEDVQAQHRVVIIGAGPVGLALAIDLAERGVPSVLIDDNDRIGDGSRAICFAKRTLEIFDRLGVGEKALTKGVQWQKGRVFHRDQELYDFDLLPEAGHKMPAFINLQQYYVEGFLVDRALELPHIKLRWKNRLTGLVQHDDRVSLTIDTPDGPYKIDAEYVVACDGARSPTRSIMGLDFKGEVFEDQFLIADVKMTADFPTERWFWFEPPFHAGQSALLHKQPDDIWRIDLQLSPDADAEHEQRPEIVRPRIEKMLGHKNFELEWVSVYRFQCRRLDQFVHDRVIFAGDAAHQVSPFGARGANSGIQDAENLAWKLAFVLFTETLYASAPDALRSLPNERNRAFLQSYHTERSYAADENISHSTRATDFIAPHTPAERMLRDAALALAPKADFAKRMINSGRLSTATTYTASPLSTPDEDTWMGGPPPGAVVPDAPLVIDGQNIFFSDLLNALSGWFILLRHDSDGVRMISEEGQGWLLKGSDALEARLDLTPGAIYLIRPDRHVAGRWKKDSGQYAKAMDLAKGVP